MNKELIKLKKSLVNTIKPSKEDIQAEKLQKLIIETRASQQIGIQRFIEEFNSEILKYEGKEWVVISKISLEGLFDDNKSQDIFYDLLNSILKAMLLVEGIGEMEM